jgi:hypothetical protein
MSFFTCCLSLSSGASSLPRKRDSEAFPSRSFRAAREGGSGPRRLAADIGPRGARRCCCPNHSLNLPLRGGGNGFGLLFGRGLGMYHPAIDLLATRSSYWAEVKTSGLSNKLRRSYRRLLPLNTAV